jgi:hypothetical protein
MTPEERQPFNDEGDVVLFEYYNKLDGGLGPC